jgi:hypothetical protein
VGPYIVKASSENEHTTEQIAAFKTEAIFENNEDMVLHEIILILESVLWTQNPHIKQNSTANG